MNDRETEPLRIGFDVSQTGPKQTGCGAVADSLLSALLPMRGSESLEFVLYRTFGDGYWNPDGPEATRADAMPGVRLAPIQPSLVAAAEFWRPAASRTPIEFEADLGRPDVVHAHNFFCPDGLDIARLVYTAHDLAFVRHPEWTTEANRALCFRGVFAASLRADAIAAVSEATRRDWLDWFPHYPADRVHVMPLASRLDADTSERRPRGALHNLGARAFLLTVATLEPRKNPLRLLRAYAEYRRAVVEPLPLVWAGARGWLCDDFDAEIDALGLGPHVLRPGFVTDEELRWLYRECAVFVYPSLFEGFGLPVLEAMAAGAPVITSTTTSLPEVAGDAAVLVDPTDEQALAQALRSVAADPEWRARLGRAGIDQAARFSWRRTAECALAIYREVVARPPIRAELPMVRDGHLA